MPEHQITQDFEGLMSLYAQAVINERPGGTVACRRGVRTTYRQQRLTLAVLRSLTGLLETGLLALDRTVVALEEAGLLEGAAVVVHVGLVQRAGDTETERTGLTGDTATRDAGDDVVADFELEHLEGLVDFLLVHLVREVVLEGATVDLPLAGARNDPDAGDGVLATAQAGSRLRVAEAAGQRLGGVLALDGHLGLAGVLLDVALELFDGGRLGGGLGHDAPQNFLRLR